MRILAAKPGHDGCIAHVVDRRLELATEAEKDSHPRYSSLGVTDLFQAMLACPQMPDALVLSGWAKGSSPLGKPIGSGYSGLAAPNVYETQLLGAPIKLISSSHERSHLMSCYGLSPYHQGKPCYSLIWEGYLGALYSIDQNLRICKLKHVLSWPGIRYAFVYALADPSFSLGPNQIRLNDAGKLMALAGFEESPEPTSEEMHILQALLSPGKINLNKNHFSHTKIFNSGVDSTHTKRLARLASNHIFSSFLSAAQEVVHDKRPLLIGGGCALNCEWNQSWLNCGLFEDVFVPPCANDTGAAIGSASDAQWKLTGNAKLEWSVYAGYEFTDDVGILNKNKAGSYIRISDQVNDVAHALHDDKILGWVNGRMEIGPRALGNRSIFASPFKQHTRDRLNRVKKRELFRPIAPVCLEECASEYFEVTKPSPHMLFFCRVKSPCLQAVTHIDGTARIQTVSASQNPDLHHLLTSFRVLSGYGVLCNTSLNFNGSGFINRTSDLMRFADEAGLDGFVIDRILFMRANSKGQRSLT